MSEIEKKCDKCDKTHTTNKCIYYQKDREKHKDAWENYGKKDSALNFGQDNQIPVKSRGQIIRQPGDGNCLFHSLSFWIEDINNRTLRQKVANFLRNNPEFKIQNDSIREIIFWDSSQSVDEYAKDISQGKWGGALEIAVFSILFNTNVNVWERVGPIYKRISHFVNKETNKEINIIYQGRMHYDAIRF